MTPVLFQYAAVDVKYLLGMKELWGPNDNLQGQLRHV